MPKKLFTHLVSVNLEIQSDQELTLSEEEITAALNKFIEENKGKYKDAVEWYDTEANS